MLNQGEKLTIIAACYNEANNLSLLFERLTKTLNKITSNWEIIFVDNSSIDGSYEIYEKLCKLENRLKVIIMSRNFFNSQPSFSAGLKNTDADLAILMDGDLQDPPELIADLVKKSTEGFDVVYAVRKKRRGSIVKRFFYFLFYRLFKFLSYLDIPLDAGDFGLINRKVIDHINKLPEKRKFIRGLRSWVGFKQTGVSYVRDERSKGKSNNSYLENCKWAVRFIINFSYSPLIFFAFAAIIFSILGCIVSLYLIFNIAKIGAVLVVSIIFLILLSLSIFWCLAVISSYLTVIFDEIKNRPEYIIKEIIN